MLGVEPQPPGVIVGLGASGGEQLLGSEPGGLELLLGLGGGVGFAALCLGVRVGADRLRLRSRVGERRVGLLARLGKSALRFVLQLCGALACGADDLRRCRLQPCLIEDLLALALGVGTGPLGLAQLGFGPQPCPLERRLFLYPRSREQLLDFALAGADLLFAQRELPLLLACRRPARLWENHSLTRARWASTSPGS